MGQSSDQIRQEIDQKRTDAAQKIDELQAQVMTTTDQLREQAQGVVDDSIQTVKDTLDVRQQIEQHPLLSLGVALAAGFALGGMTAGDRRQHRDHRPMPQPSSGASNGGALGAGASGIASTLRDVAHKSGLEETLSSAAAAFVGTVTEQVKETLDRTFPGFGEKMQSAARTPGGFAEKRQATQHDAASGDTNRVYTASGSSS